MAKPNFPEKQTWGTWEELLLACAVHRYGTDSWDSVAAELRKRSSTLHLLTSHSCKQKYNDLKHRFTQNDVVSAATEDNDGAAADGIAASIPFLDELRRLRVAELRLEVQRYDLSIVSLESKVEKLKEEREQSLKESNKGGEKVDLKKNVEEERNREEIRPGGRSPENIAEKALSGEGSVHDERSFDESNSTTLKEEIPGTGAAATDKESGPSEPAAGEPGRFKEYGKPAVEDSFNGSSDTIAKESAAVSPVQESEKVNSEKDGGGGDGGGGGDSAESKGGEEGTKEVCSSEMQSSTSLSRKKPEEPDTEDQSVASRKRAPPIESQSLVDFLEILRSHKSGSFFERRLEIQETTNYTNTIRQHMDFEMVRIRLEEGWYSGCRSKFFRDVMLIFNNTIVFFGRKSQESMAAIELRLLLLKEMAAKSTKQDSLPKEETRTPPPKPELEEPEQPSDMLLRKPKLSVPISACRKRSSITARASTSSSGPERKKEQTAALLDVKPAMSWKQSEKSSEKAEEFSGTKKRRKERFRTATRNSSNKNGASRSNSETNKNLNTANTNVGPSTRGAGNENSASKAEKEKNNSGSNASGKKRSATNFLNRMKRSSSSNNGGLLETLKDSDKGNSSKGGGGEQRKSGGGKGSSSKQKEQASRRASGGGGGGKQAKEPESPAKRSVGRPSKRAAAVAAAAAVPAKRSRQSVETEATAPRNAKKRSRK